MWPAAYPAETKTVTRGATTAEKLRGTKVWVPTPGRLRRAGWGRKEVALSSYESPGVSSPAPENL